MSTAQPRNRESFTPGSIPSPIQVSYPTPSASKTTPFSAVIPRMESTVEADCLAHDARNWLTVLKIYCDLLRNSGAVASGYEKWMEELSCAVERGHELVNSLLDSVERTGSAVNASHSMVGASSSPSTLSDRETGPLAISVASSTLEPHSLNLGEAIARRLPMFELLAGNDIQVELSTRAFTGNISLPESAFERILQNLVGNAIEAMPNGGRLRIALRPANRGPAGRYSPASRNTSISRARQRNSMLLRVYDTGSGIAPERLPYIFEAGVSGKPERDNDRPRRGFGLAIVRELTERAGGTVRVRSHPGWGSCFEVELPTI